MKLFYYQRSDGVENFGDRLNSWLWPQLLPGYFDDDETVSFIGFGTLLNHLLPQRITKAKTLIIFSTGVGYEKPLTAIPNSWKIYCVRGPLSTKKLGLSEQLAITDGAMLVRRLFQPTGEKTSQFSYMPHMHHARFAGDFLQEICQHIGFQYIDPRWPVERVLPAISKTEILLAEAMHGAIVADALRVPWIPIINSPRILRFKWCDWCASVGLNYRPYHLMPLPTHYPRYGRGLRSSLRSFYHWSNALIDHRFQDLSSLQDPSSPYLPQQLLRISQRAAPQLSDDRKVEELLQKLESCLEALTP